MMMDDDDDDGHTPSTPSTQLLTPTFSEQKEIFEVMPFAIENEAHSPIREFFEKENIDYKYFKGKISYLNKKHIELKNSHII